MAAAIPRGISHGIWTASFVVRQAPRRKRGRHTQHRTAEYAEGGLDWYALYYRAGYESDFTAYGRALEDAVSRKYQENGGLDRVRASSGTGQVVATACGGDALAFGTNAAGKPSTSSRTACTTAAKRRISARRASMALPGVS